MSRETESPDHDDDAPDPSDEEGQRSLDGELLSDLSVNIVPIGIIAAFTLLFVVRTPGADDTVLLFHGALVGGVVLVSIVAGWAIRRKRSPLEGSAGRNYDTERE